MKRRMARVLAMVMAVVLMGTSTNVTAFAVGICDHHLEHTAGCGYVEAIEGADCTHVHDDECYSEVEVCVHEHDENCGYVQAVEGRPCSFVCNVCDAEASDEDDEDAVCICEDKCTADAVNEECPVCSLEEADLTLCAGEAVEEEEETDTCICEEKCTADIVNEECPVCAAENADLNNCIGEATEEKIITAWSFIDEYECIDLETNTLALPGANAENVALKSDVISLLPTSIVATVNETEENITLSGWECEDYPETGAYAGTYTFSATLPEGYTLGEEVSELTVNVELGGAGLYDEEQTTGDFTVTGGTNGQDYTYDSEARLLTIQSSKEITIANTNQNTPTEDRIFVADDVNANITLAGVNIDVSAQRYKAAFKIADNSAGNVTITLADGTTNTLKSGEYCAGLQKNGAYISETQGKLTITGTGSLTATGGDYGAGIGGCSGGSGSNITISGGTVTATGGDYGAGIGGCYGGSADNITISGGTVTATGGGFGAGIGGGLSGSNIKISGGVVTATGDDYGAGIGGGFEGNGSNIEISGGKITATGGERGAGIGGGYKGSGSNIEITGGSVKAVAGEGFETYFPAAIGQGVQYDGVYSNGAEVTPTDGNGNNVYLLELTSATSSLKIDGNDYPINHGTDGKVYVYLPEGEHTIVKDGGAGTTARYAKNADNKLEAVAIGTAFTITGTDLVYGTDYTYTGGVLTILSDKAMTIANADPSTPTTDRIEVADGVSANITLAGVNIDVSAQNYTAAFKIDDNSAGNVTITLADGTTNTLKSGKYCAGLQKNGAYISETQGKLTITGTGSLTATGGERGAGIGGGDACDGSNITVSGGTVTATGGAEGGAGIGGGNVGSGSNIKISGGKVTAIGGDYGAGIGGGNYGSGSNIEISGGTVTATGGDYGAGIGGGYKGSGSNIEISGGTVTATGGERGAGIGGGYKGSGSNIEISGGTVTATGGDYGAGIGGGYGGSADNITISGGSVKAVAGEGFEDEGTTYFPAAIGQGVQYDSNTGVYSNGAEVTPTDGNGNNVYLLELTSATSSLKIDGKDYPINHGTDGKVYVYLPEGEHTIVKDGGAGTTARYAKNADNKLEPTAFTITGTDLVYGVDYTYPTSTGVLTILSDKDITIANTNPSTSITDRIEVADGVSANITLAGVNIDVSPQSNTAAFKIADNSAGNVTITLADGTTNTLKSGGNCAGLQKNGEYSETLGKLTITGTGSLTATGGGYGAGIGGVEIFDGSNITISGGTVTATGGERGAGIGGGYSSGSGRGGSGSNIKISGGTVTATGGRYGAGIGGGDGCDGSYIEISGGTVTAQGGEYGAGIGGSSGGADNITISGGTVTATGGAGGAGIGGGNGGSGSGSNITINGGTVTATGGEYGAGIGGGHLGSGSNIKISGGTVTATGGEDGAGIGGGYCGNADNIKISGGVVIANGGSGAYDIGGSSTDNIKISGGSVKADTIGCTPTDGTANATPVYLLKFKVDGTSAVTINGKAYPTKHIDENKLYVYLPAGIYTVANGNSQKIYTIADNGDVSEFVVGTAFTITGTDLVYGTDYTYPASTGVLTILSDKDIAIKNANPSTPTTNRIEVADGVSANITLAGVNIDVPSKSYTAAFQIAENSTGDVTITLADGTTNTLKSGTYCAGLQKNGEYSETLGKLTITGTGTLTATGGDYNGAGIGGGRSGSGSNIEISGGTVTATGGEGGAGIGGGWSGSGSDIKISGGTVTATGGEYGAGIGGGKSGSGSNIEISGSNIEISGGTVTATGGKSGAGIGGGYYGSGSYITISGGTVTAQGGDGGAGIGGSDSDGRAVGCNIKISGGTVTATGGKSGAGIGGGISGSGSNIEISGGTVTATGGESGAGIGGGYNRSADNIKISGGEVTATGGKGGAGIGGGYPRGSADNITISGGSVKAVAGEKYKYDNTTYFPAAIGQSVQYNDSTSVHSNGAEVTPTDGNGNNVYLLELDVDGTSAVTINGKAYPTKHFNENKVYIYLPAKTAQAPNEVTVGNETTKYCYINAKWLKVVDSPEADDTEFTYDGTEKTYTLAESKNYTITGNKQTNAGTYTVTVALNDKDNTVWNDGTTEDKEYSFVIYKADSVLETVPTPKTGLIYKGEGQNLISAGTATGGTMQYSLNFVSWSPDIPSATDAGEYTVYYKIAGNENYNGSEADSFTVNIAKKQLTVTEVAATSRDYIANDKTVDITGITLSGIQGTDDVSVKITGLKGTLSSANAGTYTSVTLPTLTLINDDKENYELVQPTSAVATNVTINKLNPTITLTVQTSITKTYGDEIFDLGATEDSPEAGLQYEVTEGADVVSVSSTGKVTILKAGDATITVTVPVSTNYNSVSKEISVTVEKAENAPNIPGNAMNVSNSYTKIGDVPLPTGWEWQDAYKETLLTVDTPVRAEAVYTGADKGNYENESVEIVVTRADHDHVESEVLYDTNAGEHAPTCTEDGLGHVECTIEGCDETLRTNVVVDALGHNYVSKVTKQPTTTEEGIMTYTCSNCGDSYTKPISKLPSSGGGSDDDSGDDETGGSSGSSSDGGSTNDTPATETPTPQTPTGGTTAPTTPQPGGKTPVAEPDEETDNPEPFIKGDDGKEGWDVISGEVEDAEEGDTVTVNMNGTTVVPGDVLNDIKGKDVTVVFDLGNGVAWSVNGKDITSDNVGDIDFEVKVGADANDSIPVEVRNAVTGESNFVNISLAYDGEFGFEAVLSVNLEKENAGLYANLFYYNPQTNEMEFICSDVIAEDGNAELIFTHASEYTIVIDEAAMDAPASSEEGILPEIGVEAEENNSSDATNVSDPLEFGSDDNNSAWWIILLIALLAVAGVAGFVVYSKKKKSE